MDIASKWNKFFQSFCTTSLGQRSGMMLFFSMIALLWFFVGCFIYYQYHREKEFKIRLLTTQLLQLNDEIAFKAIQQDSLLIHDIDIYEKNSQLQNLRVTIMDTAGNVLRDNIEPNTVHFQNHLHRHEIQQALEHGTGFTIRRSSESLGTDYFYAASKYSNKGFIVRSALPYDINLMYNLKADMGFVWFSVCVTLVLTFVLYRQTRMFGNMVDRLQEEENSKLKRQLSLNMSHELKTPVSSIQGYVETILNNPKLDEKQRTQFLSRCHVQTKRLTSLLRDINTLNRIDEVPDQLEKTSLDLNRLIDGIKNDVQLSLSQRNMTAEIHIPEEIPIIGNEGLLYSVFRNLFDNSIAYAGDGSCIRLVCPGIENGMWHFQYSDNGVGISDEHLPSIFNRFYRVDKGRSRRIGGTGLGLAIVKNAVQFHGGNIVVQQSPSGELVFDFTLKPGVRS